MILTPIMTEVAYAVESIAKENEGISFGKNGVFAQAYGLFNIAWALGGIAGPLVGGLLNQSCGWPVTTLVLAG